jgi:hypothetical protein
VVGRNLIDRKKNGGFSFITHNSIDNESDISPMMATMTKIQDCTHLSSFVPSTIASVSASTSKLLTKRMEREGQLRSKSTLELFKTAQKVSANPDVPFNHDLVRKQMLRLM